MPDDDTWLSAFNLNNHSSQLVSFGTLASVFRQFQMTALPEQQVLPVIAPEMISLALSGESIDPAVMDDFVRRRFGLVATDTLQYRISVQTSFVAKLCCVRKPLRPVISQHFRCGMRSRGN
jgi:hypothetical protein